MSNSTPLMSQYRDIKAQYDDCILFFRVGDFYETFYEDAVEVSSLLNIALTTRDKNQPNPIPLAGVPFHAAETYINRLLRSGRSVAVCDQVEDAKQARGLVKREVVEVLTPGTAMSAQLLTESENNYCVCLYAPSPGTGSVGVALIDVSTGDFLCGETRMEEADHLLQGKHVREVIRSRSLPDEATRALLEALGAPAEKELDDTDDVTAATEALTGQLGAETTASLSPLARIAAGKLLLHCKALRGGALPQVTSVELLGGSEFMSLDTETIGNLEFFETARGGDASATLVRAMDRTLTSMGGRELRRWMEKPLCAVKPIEERLDAVDAFYSNDERLERVRVALKGISDIQRLGARIAARKAIPREFHALRESLERIPELRAALGQSGARFLEKTIASLGDHEHLCQLIDRTIVADPPGHMRDGGVIQRGCDSRLDRLIEESEAARKWITDLEARERKAIGVGSLKVGFNRVFGYYLEVSRANIANVPDRYIQKQTLVSAQRYYTQELKEKEDLILHTEEQRIEHEARVYESLHETVTGLITDLQETSNALARIDVVQSLATVARMHGYHRPLVDESKVLEIVAGRHPVLERFGSEAFVPNDLRLEPERRQFGLITGPNMSGKSTFLRQTALMVVLAHMGSYVPAARARIGLVDKVFTRVGASDRLSRGESTFLVEMNETANILENMTDRSLVILDEVGRGTSTYDGLSIAWAVTEYILEGAAARPRTLFATHFHELTQLGSKYGRLLNLKISIREWEGGIIFLRKVVSGTSDRSFGIHAAKIAGLPAVVLKRAEDILALLELRRSLVSRGVDVPSSEGQIGLFDPATRPENVRKAPDPCRQAVADFDLQASSPMDAFDLIRRLKDEA
ncbi:MAG: DNA mismatch repair protein MutS [Candidatus Krumholzibacteriota bacterium]|nr:DNA mismatch repair protein MutS [Candidatus Krumholzibacteriota bacterium]